MSKILRNMSVMTLSIGVTLLISLLLRMLMPRILGPERLGVFVLAESYATIFFSFLPLGLGAYIYRTLPKRPEHVKEILWSVLVLQAVTAFVIGLILCAWLFYIKVETELLHVTLLMGVWLALFTFQKSVFQRVFLALGEVALVSKLDIVVKIIQVGGCVAILYLAPNLKALALMHAIAEFCGFIWLFILAQKSGYLADGPRTRLTLDMLKLSLPFYFAGVLQGINGQINASLLGSYGSTLEVGYYGSAFRLIGVFLMLVPVLSNTVTPVLSQALGESLASFETLVHQFLRGLMLACLGLASVLVLFSDWIVPILFGESFGVSSRIVVFLTPVLVMMYLNVFVGSCLYLTTDGKQLSIIFTASLILNFALNSQLIPWGMTHFGTGGGGLAVSFVTFVCELAGFIAMLSFLPFRIFNVSFGFKVFLLLLPCWLGMSLTSEIFALSLWQRFALLAIVPIYAWAGGFVRLADWHTLRHSFQRKSS